MPVPANRASQIGAFIGESAEAGYIAVMDPKREFFRHTLAALAYRATRALDGAPDDFAHFAGAGRTPAQILAHMGDLFDWSLSILQGHETWHNSKPLAWADQKRRFFAALKAFDDALAAPGPIHGELERLFQGPVADALTHTGQLAMMRRLAGSKIPGENYFAANIAAGQVEMNQSPPVVTF